MKWLIIKVRDKTTSIVGTKLTINVKVYDVINCLYKNSITHFAWYLEKEERYDIETLSIYGVLDKEHFYRKIM